MQKLMKTDVLHTGNKRVTTVHSPDLENDATFLGTVVSAAVAPDPPENAAGSDRQGHKYRGRGGVQGAGRPEGAVPGPSRLPAGDGGAAGILQGQGGGGQERAWQAGLLAPELITNSHFCSSTLFSHAAIKARRAFERQSKGQTQVSH